MSAFKKSLLIFGILFLLNLLGLGPFGWVDFYGYLGSVIVGCVLMPVSLTWIPGRAFAWKGWILGLAWAVFTNILNGWPQDPQYGLLRALGYVLICPSVSAYLAMNFTRSSTHISFSGVLKAMKFAIPVIIITIFIGSVLILVNSFI